MLLVVSYSGRSHYHATAIISFPIEDRGQTDRVTTSRYDSMRDAILTCPQKLAQVSLIQAYRVEPKTTKMGKKNK